MIPLHLPPGDTSTERTLQIDGTSEQIEAAKQLVNEVIAEVCFDDHKYLSFISGRHLVALEKKFDCYDSFFGLLPGCLLVSLHTQTGDQA